MLQVTSTGRPTVGDGILGGRIGAALTPERVALAMFLAITGIVLANILLHTGGRSLYALDDAYIHLAFAERLRLGHYGLNLGEITAPSSSVIWPFLLVPTAGTPLAHATPLLLNIAFGAITAWLLGRIAAWPRLPADWTPAGAQLFRIALACLLVVATNIVNLVFIGLEHSLQVMIAVALAVALIQRAEGTPLPTWVLALTALGPSVRYEMLALTAAVALLLVLERRWRTLAVFLAASLALPALLAAFLVANGGYPLPNSVMAKLLNPATATSLADSADLGMAERTWRWLQRLGGIDLQARVTVLASLGVLAWWWRGASGGWRLVLPCLIAAGVLHMLVGQFGWWYRYELYIVGLCTTIAIALTATRQPYAAMMLGLLAATHYLPSVTNAALAARNIHEQHFQMHRLVADHYRKPFAANDIGWVSMGLARGPYVLDLWGLASAEALRQKDKSAAWLDDVTRRHGTGLAIVYPTIFNEIPASWTKVGTLELASQRITAAQETVAFYATAAGTASEIAAALAALKPGLPAGVKLEIFEK